jgi:ABC-type multidrug transport system fused ATPase/permease subunit
VPCLLLGKLNSSQYSLERIQRYIEIEQEPKPTAAGVPPAYWPASGNISVDKLSAKYSPDGPTVLHDISFNIKSGERVGVGKSYCIERSFKELTVRHSRSHGIGESKYILSDDEYRD